MNNFGTIGWKDCKFVCYNAVGGRALSGMDICRGRRDTAEELL